MAASYAFFAWCASQRSCRSINFSSTAISAPRATACSSIIIGVTGAVVVIGTGAPLVRGSVIAVVVASVMAFLLCQWPFVGFLHGVEHNAARHLQLGSHPGHGVAQREVVVLQRVLRLVQQ